MVPPPAGASGILLPRPRTPHETRVLAARRAVEAAAVELRARQRVGPDGAPLARADQRRESDSSSLGFGSSLDAESSELSFLRPVEDEHPNRLAVDDAANRPARVRGKVLPSMSPTAARASRAWIAAESGDDRRHALRMAEAAWQRHAT